MPKEGDDSLAGLAQGLASIGELGIIFDRLAKVAIEEIETAVVAGRDADPAQRDNRTESALNPWRDSLRASPSA